METAGVGADEPNPPNVGGEGKGAAGPNTVGTAGVGKPKPVDAAAGASPKAAGTDDPKPDDDGMGAEELKAAGRAGDMEELKGAGAGKLKGAGGAEAGVAPNIKAPCAGEGADEKSKAPVVACAEAALEPKPI